MTPFRLVSVVLLLAVGGLVAAARAGDQIYTFHYEQVLGTSFELKVVAPSAAIAARAETAAMEEIARNARILSSYDPDSEFSRWFQTRGVPTRVSPELFEVLSLFDRWRMQSSGALNPAAEAATRLWKTAAGQGRIPADAELTAVVRQVRRTHWTLNSADRTATHITDVPLALNSFTKGFIIERAAGAAMSAGGVRAVVVNIGGDLVVRGDWTEPVRVANPISDAENATPLATIAIANRAVATSGGYRRGVDIDGHHYSHIVDPRTARPAGHILSATVTAPDAVTAGALATAFCVLSPQESRAIAAAIPGVEFTLVERDGGTVASAAWQTLEAPVEPPVRLAAMPAVYAAEQGTWDPAFELAVNVELARFDGFGGRRPYVAVWIEDTDRFPVRTLALWFQKPRWLADLKSWYRSDRMRAMAEGSDVIASVSSATRAAGRYTLKWDGKDSHGKPVKAGTYTVCIEAAREHGTYQIIRHEMDFSGVPQQVNLTGNVEIAAASLDYRKPAAR